MPGQLVVMVVGLLVLACVFGVIERIWPDQRRGRRTRGVGTDIAWFFWDGIVNRPISFVFVVLVAVLIALLVGAGGSGDSIRAYLERETAIQRQPAWLQAVQLLVLFDLTGYWSHRMFHRRSLLWRFHAVHHSSEELDWLSAVRVHPVNELGQRAAQAVPLVVLGFDPAVVAAYVPLFTAWAIALHANLSWDLGWFKYVLASPRFHRWHHTSEQEGLDRNFAGLFPWIDVLFGTLYMPAGRKPEVFGILNDHVPEGLHRQLLWPFRRRRVREPAVAG